MKTFCNKWWEFFFWPILTLFVYLASLLIQLDFLKPLILGFILALQGFSLAKIFSFDFKGDLWLRLTMYLFLGLVSSLALVITAVIIGLTVIQLLWVFLIFVVFALILAVLLSLKRKEKNEPIELKKIFVSENLIDLVVLGGLIILLTVVYHIGSHFQGGDPSFHLSIMRKAFDGEPLGLNALNYVKGSINLAYGFPIWHVFVAMYAKLVNLDLFFGYKTITVFLSIFSVLIWYSLGRQIFNNKFLAALISFFLMFFCFYYTFTTMVLPDVFSQFILLPLCLLVSTKYIFEKQKFIIVIFLSLLLLEMLAIHATQYFYYLIIMILFAVFYALSAWREANKWQILKRFLTTVGLNWLVILPFIVFMEMKAKTIFSALEGFMNTSLRAIRYNKFSTFYVLARHAYLFAPLLFLFRKERKIFLILAVLISTPLVYFTPLKELLMRFLGYIFVNRLYANTNWYFVFWALMIGILLIYLNKILLKLPKFVKRVYLILSTGLLFWLINLQFKSETLSKFYKSFILSEKLINFSNQNYWKIWLVTAGLLLIIWLIGKYRPKFNNLFTLDQINPIYILPTLLIIIFFLFTPRFKTFSESFNPAKIAEKQFSVAATINLAGGADALKFIKENIPPKSVFLTKGRGLYLTMMADQYLPAYPHSADETKINGVFGTKLSAKEKLDLLKTRKVQYLILTNSADDLFFSQNKTVFTKLFEGKSIIYQVNLEQIL